MEEGRWKMWTARCDQVHRKEDDVTISEREKTYAKIKQFWIQHVGMRSVDKSMVEVLQMSQETRGQWMQQVKGREYSTTRMDDYFDVGESQPRAPKEKAATPVRASKKSIKITTMFKRLRNGEQRDGAMAENDEVVEIETGSNDTTQNQTQVAQRRTARSNALPHNIGNLARFFTRHIHHQHGGR
jgi:hypothetical protein